MSSFIFPKTTEKDLENATSKLVRFVKQEYKAGYEQLANEKDKYTNRSANAETVCCVLAIVFLFLICAVGLRVEYLTRKGVSLNWQGVEPWLWIAGSGLLVTAFVISLIVEIKSENKSNRCWIKKTVFLDKITEKLTSEIGGEFETYIRDVLLSDKDSGFYIQDFFTSWVRTLDKIRKDQNNYNDYALTTEPETLKVQGLVNNLPYGPVLCFSCLSVTEVQEITKSPDVLDFSFIDEKFEDFKQNIDKFIDKRKQDKIKAALEQPLP